MSMKEFKQIKYNKSHSLFSLFIIFLVLIESTSFTTYSTILYFKSDGIFKGMNHLNSNNNNNDVKRNYTDDDMTINDNLYMVEITDSFYSDKIKINFENPDRKI